MQLSLTEETEMTIEMLSSFKTQAILDVYNYLNPDAPLKSWDKNKLILVERLAAKFDKATIEKAMADTESGPKPGKKGKVDKKPAVKAKKPTTATKAKSDKPKGQGVGATIRALLAAKPEATALEILAEFQKKFPDAKTTAGCVSWYRSQMYKTGELVK